MSITNLNNTHLSETELSDALAALASLETALSAVNINLTATDRQKYGRINERNKLVVSKVNDYHKNQPELQAAQVDWDEFEKDFASRNNLEAMILRLESLATRLRNAKILHDHDNYQAALTDYAYTSFMAGASASGYETKMNEIKQFFSGTRHTEPSENTDNG